MSKLQVRRGHDCQLPEISESLRSEKVIGWACDECGTRWQWTRLAVYREVGPRWRPSKRVTVVDYTEGSWHPVEDHRWHMVDA